MVNHLSKSAMLKRAQSPNLFSEARAIPYSMIERPVFLVGSERSGTTLLRLMLDHHPEIMFWAEFEYGVYQMGDDGRYPALADYYQRLLADRNFLMDGPNIDRRLSYPELVNSFLRQFQDFTDKPIVGATVHHHFDRLLQIWPDARFIHIVRDGRDVARSCMKMGWAGDGWHGAQRWLTAETLWESLKTKLPADRQIEVRFEDLITDTVDTLTQVCHFLGESYHPDMMSYAKNTDYALPDTRLISQWHNNLSKREIQLIESRIAPLLVERGYPLSGLPHLRVSDLGRLWLKVENKLGTLAYRARKYGLPLMSADFLARRLRLTGLSDRIRKKINVIDIKTMKQSW
ncbi:MAG: sulfotransferase [Cyanobacteria bacterium J06623_5]